MNAALIICHKNPLQVIRLARKIKTDTCDIYIHADLNMSQEDFACIMQYSETQDGVYLLANRIHGELDKRSLIDITILLINRARQNESMRGTYRYFILLSGQDYPIKPMAWIEEQLIMNYPKPFIDCTPYHINNWVYHKFSQNKALIKYNSWISNSMSKGLVRSGFRVTAICAKKVCQIIGLTAKQKLDRIGIEIYGGSAWWILPDRIIEFVQDEYNQKKDYIQILLDSSHTPEETFFQILAMRSPLKDLVEVNPPEMVAQNCKTWAYFSDVDKPFKGHPYIFTINELEKVLSSSCWFARKFDVTVDETILDEIDKHQVIYE